MNAAPTYKVTNIEPPKHYNGTRELARKAGISPTTASRVLSGKGNFSLETFRKVLPYLDRCPCCGKEQP